MHGERLAAAKIASPYWRKQQGASRLPPTCMSSTAASHTVACKSAKSVPTCAPGQHWLRQPSSLDVLLLEGGLVGHDEAGYQVQRGLQILPPQLEQSVNCMTHDALPGSHLQHHVPPAGVLHLVWVGRECRLDSVSIQLGRAGGQLGLL